MVWFRVDDSFAKSRKVLSIPKRRRAAAIGVWTLAGTWCAGELTDGFLPRYALDEIPSGAQFVGDLVDAGLLTAVSRGSRVFPDGSPTDPQHLFDGTPKSLRVIPDDGWVFRNWSEYQRSREDVEKERSEHAARQQAYRDRLRAKRDGSRDASRDAAVTAASVTTARPDPTRPDPTVVPTELQQQVLKDTSSPAAPSTPSEPDPWLFTEFWKLYPRKVGKEAARKSWGRAVHKANPDEIVAAAARYGADPNLPDEQFIPHPAKWLNDGRWSDPPLAGRTGRPKQATTDERVTRNMELARRIEEEEDRTPFRQIGTA